MNSTYLIQWLLGGLLTIVLAATGLIVTMVRTRLGSHSKMIGAHGDRISRIEGTIGNGLRESIEDVKQRLIRLEDRFDRVIESARGQ